MARHVVCALAELPPGGRTLVSVKGRDVAVFNVAGELFAILDRCPHMGASLCKGKLTGLMSAAEPGRYGYSRAGEILRCPWHGWEFDLRTGKSCAEPEHLRVKSYEVSVVGGDDAVAEVVEPLEATVFPVAVEDSWIVIDA